MYRIIDESTIYRVSDFTSIPMDLEKADYQAYLQWLAVGNEPESGPGA
ncbi:hypothetical protein ACFWP0_19860 [Achromobacter sp. NPDC058515]